MLDTAGMKCQLPLSLHPAGDRNVCLGNFFGKDFVVEPRRFAGTFLHVFQSLGCQFLFDEHVNTRIFNDRSMHLDAFITGNDVKVFLTTPKVGDVAIEDATSESG